MILGIGVDAVKISRLEEKKRKNHSDFFASIFSTYEQEICTKSNGKMDTFAANFAAKEAFLKALGTGLSLNYPLSEIEIIRDKAGKPLFQFSDNIINYLKNKFEVLPSTHISLTHEDDLAIAMVVLEK
jgi:holo-[acyl-carrier protein] synthase